MSVKNIYKGISVSNSSVFLVNEYLQRERLAKLGIISDFDKIDVFTAEALRYIADCFLRCEQDEIKAKKRGK